MVVEVVVGAAEEGAEATTNKRGVATEEVGVAKTVHNIAELKTSEKRRKMHYNNNYYGLNQVLIRTHKKLEKFLLNFLTSPSLLLLARPAHVISCSVL